MKFKSNLTIRQSFKKYKQHGRKSLSILMKNILSIRITTFIMDQHGMTLQVDLGLSIKLPHLLTTLLKRKTSKIIN